MISAKPDIQSAAITEEDRFLVVACDGIWCAFVSGGGGGGVESG